MTEDLETVLKYSTAVDHQRSVVKALEDRVRRERKRLKNLEAGLQRLIDQVGAR